MKKCCIIFLLLHQHLFAQTPINRQQFFLDENVIEVTFSTDLKNLKTQKKTPTWQPANIVMRFSDTLEINENIRVEPRGEFRKNNCDIAALMLDFKNPSSPKLSPLKKLKLVGGCRANRLDEELLLREYLVYKIYNLITNMSFRVRLLHITYKDTKEKNRTYTQYAFLIEDIKDMADRNNCVEYKLKSMMTQPTHREHMTTVTIFQYMVGNTDWSIHNFHNIKMLVPKADTTDPPFVVAYDFDYTGIVNAAYAIPDEQFGAKTVTERVYRGAPRAIGELESALDIFKQKKERIMFYVNNFPFLSNNAKKEITLYLEGFYDTIESKGSLRTVFKGTKE